MDADVFGLEYDRIYFLPILKWVQLIYGLLMIIIVHPTFFYLLLTKSKGFHSGIRRGYIANQMNMLIHDIYNNIAHRMYAPLPYPAVYCFGFLCQAMPDRGFELLILQCIIIAHAIPPYFYMILNTTQQILPHSSKFKISSRTIWILLSLVYADLCLNAVYFAVSKSIQRPELFDQISDFKWLKSYEGAIYHWDRRGLERSGQLFIFLYIFCLFYVSFHGMDHISRSVYTDYIQSIPKRPRISRSNAFQNISSTRSHKMQVRFMRILLIQTSLVVVFYGLPLATLVGMVKFYEFPPFALSLGRCIPVFMYSINSFVECTILLIMTPKYQTIIKNHIHKFCESTNALKNVNRFENSVTTKF